MGIYIGDIEVEKVSLGPTAVVKTAVGTIEVPAPSAGYKQKWSTEQPSQHNTPVPLDIAGVDAGLTDVSVSSVFAYDNSSAETVGVDASLVGSSVSRVFQYDANNVETVGVSVGLQNVTVETVEL